MLEKFLPDGTAADASSFSPIAVQSSRGKVNYHKEVLFLVGASLLNRIVSYFEKLMRLVIEEKVNLDLTTNYLFRFV